MTETSSHDCPKTMAVIRNGQVITGCEACINSKRQQGLSATYERNYQRRQYRKDIIQPNEPMEYVKAYGADKAREAGYSESQIRKYG